MLDKEILIKEIEELRKSFEKCPYISSTYKDGIRAGKILAYEDVLSEINKVSREGKPKDIAEFLNRLTVEEQEFLWEHIEKIKQLEREDE